MLKILKDLSPPLCCLLRLSAIIAQDAGRRARSIYSVLPICRLFVWTREDIWPVCWNLLRLCHPAGPFRLLPQPSVAVSVDAYAARHKTEAGSKKSVSQRLNKVRPRRNAYSGRSLSLRVVECTRRPFCLFLINRWPRRLPAHLGIDIKGLANLRSSKCCKEEYLWQPYLVGETFHIDFQVRYVLTNYMYLSYRQVFQFCRFLAGFLFLHLLDFYFSILFPYRVTLKVHKYFATS